MNHPYQVVAFFDKKPDQGDLVYEGKKGWFPQVALKRRFGLSGIDEKELALLLAEFTKRTGTFVVRFLEAEKPEHMPVKVIEVEPSAEVVGFHNDFIEFFGERITSKYADREGGNYSPHMTIEWDGKIVVEPSDFEHTSRQVDEVWLLKDDTNIENSDSRVLMRLTLGS